MKKGTAKKSQSLKIIIYEHISGGGYSGCPLPQNLLVEGFGMLRSLVTDLKAAGHETTVLIDQRLTKLNPPLDSDYIVPIFYPDEPERFVEKIANINDAIYIIAPESDKILQKWVRLVEKTGKLSLNCKSRGISQVGDKATLYECLKERGFDTPKTQIINSSCDLKEVELVLKNKFSYPVIFKPSDGTSCSGLSVVRNSSQIADAITKIENNSTTKSYLIQEYLNGVSASVNLISNGKKAFAISLNEQIVNLCENNDESKYFGGCVPLNHPIENKALVLAEKVVESFIGLQGYIGVDFVLTKNAAYVVDMNPRLTTSYIGASRVTEYNIAEAMINALINGEMPRKKNRESTVCFSKVEIDKPSMMSFRQIARLRNVISPPFPLENQSKSCALVIGEGSNVSMARAQLEEVKKELLDRLKRGI